MHTGHPALLHIHYVSVFLRDSAQDGSNAGACPRVEDLPMSSLCRGSVTLTGLRAVCTYVDEG